MADKAKVTRIVTPAFVAMFAWIGKPNTKHDKKGKYMVSGAFDPKNKEHRAFLGQLKKLHAENVAECQKNYKAPKPKKKGDAPEPMKVQDVMEQQDDGTYKVNFSESAYIDIDDKAKPGQTKRIDLKPLVVDAKGMPTDVDPWSGSVLKVSIDVVAFYNGSLGAGLQRRLKGVQVLQLKTGGSRDGASLGFGVEEGFSATDFTGQSNTASDDDAGNEFLDDSGTDDAEPTGEEADAPAAEPSDDGFDF